MNSPNKVTIDISVEDAAKVRHLLLDQAALSRMYAYRFENAFPADEDKEAINQVKSQARDYELIAQLFPALPDTQTEGQL